MILSVRNDYTAGAIRTGLIKALLRKDEECRWKEGMTVHFWKGYPQELADKPYQFALGIMESIKDMIYYREKDIITLIHGDGSFTHLKEEKQKAEFVKDLGFSSWWHFKNKYTVQKEYHYRMLYWKKEIELL